MGIDGFWGVWLCGPCVCFGGICMGIYLSYVRAQPALYSRNQKAGTSFPSPRFRFYIS